jgi:hypothetical protein
MKYLFTFENFDSLNEERGSAQAVKTVVRDIIYFVKDNAWGRFSLPYHALTDAEAKKAADPDRKPKMKGGKFHYIPPRPIKTRLQMVGSSFVKEVPKDVEDESEYYYGMPDAGYEDEDDDNTELLSTHKYVFNDFPVKFSVDLTIQHNKKIKGFRINASAGSHYRLEKGDRVAYYDIQVEIQRNFQEDIKPHLYEMVGELNIDISHEMEHLLQEYYGEEFDRDEDATGFTYYTLPDELPAQVVGFKRLFDLKRVRDKSVKFEDIVRQWFIKQRYISKLRRNEEEEVIKNIVDEFKSKFDRL